MKVKLSLDKETVKQFFLDHSEKLVVGVVVLAAGWLVVQSFGREQFKSTPEEMAKAAGSARAHIDAERTEALDAPDYVAVARLGREKIEEGPYRSAVAWSPPDFPQRHKRPEPPVFAAQQCRGGAAMASFATRPRPGAAAIAAESVRGYPWVTVTALVPVEKQRLAYEEAFRDSVLWEPQKDAPQYLGFFVDRIEINSPADREKPDWSKALTMTSYEEMSRVANDLAETAPEVVDPKYLDPRLTFPLPQSRDYVWGAEAVHAPQIPLAAPAGTGPESIGPATPVTPPAPGGFDVGGPEPVDSQVAAHLTETEATAEQPPEYKLLRFLDFRVVPGKQYMYRVRLVLANPNYDLRPFDLESVELAKKKYLQPTASEPSNVVTVPRDVELMVVGVRVRGGSNPEPAADVVVRKYLLDRGVEAHQKFKVVRGQVANWPDQPLQQERAAEPDEGMGFAPVAAPAATAASVRVDYVTDYVAVDMIGGERFSHTDPMTKPGEVLFLDQKGRLIVHRELDDLAVYHQLTGASTAAAGETEAFGPGGPEPPPGPESGRGDIDILLGPRP